MVQFVGMIVHDLFAEVLNRPGNIAKEEVRLDRHPFMASEYRLHVARPLRVELTKFED